MTDEPELIAARRGRAGRITLNRPKALNALTHAMILDMIEALLAWQDDPDVACVVVDGAGERAFCAGADIRRLYEQGKGGEAEKAFAFFRDEYRLNALIAGYPKPYVALIDGVTMGGGVGLSAHGHYRVATERTLWAMPETGIGLFPDVGAAHVLARLPDCAGTWLGLTGARLNGADTAALGLATHLAPGEAIPALIEALEGGAAPEAALADFRAAEGLDPVRAQTKRLFAADTVEAVLEALQADGGDWAQEQAEAIAARSPTSLKLTMEAVRRAGGMSLEEVLRQDLRIAARCLEGHDFYEGVRAQIVDKDRDPQWRPAMLAGVGEDAVAAYFAPVQSERELDFLSEG